MKENLPRNSEIIFLFFKRREKIVTGYTSPSVNVTIKMNENKVEQ